MRLETLLPLGKVDPGLRAPEVPLDLASVGRDARLLEEIGYHGLVVEETKDDPFILMALAAQATTMLRVGTSVAIAFPRSPAVTAMSAWTLSKLSKGRFTLGLGTQVKAHIERRFGMPWPESVMGKLREQILAMRALWDCWQHGTKLNFRGAHYKLTLMSPFFNPGPIEHPAIPIYLAGVNVGLARLAGELCDGFVIHPFHSPRYLKEVLLPAVQAGLNEAGRKRESVSLFVTAFVATNPEEVAFARSQLAFYASTPSYQRVMALHGWADTAAKLSAHARRGEWDAMSALLSDDMLQAFCLVADEGEVARGLQARYAGLADRISLYNAFVPGQHDAYWQRLAAAFHSMP